MQLIHQQISAVAQQQLTQQLAIVETLSGTAFDSIEKLISLQFQLVRQFFNDHQPATPSRGNTVLLAESQPAGTEKLLATETSPTATPVAASTKHQQLALLDAPVAAKTKTRKPARATAIAGAKPLAAPVKVSGTTAAKSLRAPQQAAAPQTEHAPVVSAVSTPNSDTKLAAVAQKPAVTAQGKAMPAFPFATPQLAVRKKTAAATLKRDDKPVANKKTPVTPGKNAARK